MIHCLETEVNRGFMEFEVSFSKKGGSFKVKQTVHIKLENKLYM